MLRKIFGWIWIQKSEFEICETKEAARTKYAVWGLSLSCDPEPGAPLYIHWSDLKCCSAVDLYLALFSRLCVLLYSYMGVSSERIGFIYTVVRVSGPIGRHCVFSTLWGVPQCAPSTENNQKQSNTKWTQIKPRLILNDFFSLCFSVNFNHPLSSIGNEEIWK